MKLERFGKLTLSAIFLLVICYGKGIGCCSGGDEEESVEDHKKRKEKEEAEERKCLADQGMSEVCIKETLHPNKKHDPPRCANDTSMTREQILEMGKACGIELPASDEDFGANDDHAKNEYSANNGKELCARVYGTGRSSSNDIYEGDHSNLDERWTTYIHVRPDCSIQVFTDTRFRGTSDTWSHNDIRGWYWTYRLSEGWTYGWVGYWWRNDIHSAKCDCY